MADVYFKCACGKSLAIDVKGVGLTVLCVDCGQPVKVPEFDIEFACEQCQATLLAPVAVGGDRIKCAFCGHRMAVPRPVVEAGAGKYGELADEDVNGAFRAIKEKQTLPATKLCMEALMRKRSEFQARRRPLPEPSGSGWYRSVGWPFRLAILVGALVVTAGLIHRFIQERQLVLMPQEPGAEALTPSAADIASGTKTPTPETVETLAASVQKPKATPETVRVREMTGKESVFVTREPARISNIPPVPASAKTPARNLGPMQSRSAATAAKVAEARVGHPAQPLFAECQEVKAILRQNPTDRKNAVLIGKIKKCREHVLDYTQTHTGADLDGPYWKNAVVGTLWLSSYREWNSFEDADRAIREAMEILAEAKPEKSGLNIKTIFDVILLHEQVWYRQAPEACAQWLDEACALAFDEGNASLRERWGFIAPSREINLIFAASILPPERRQAFQNKRERNLLSYLRDEGISFEWRTKDLWWWAVNLKTAGEMKKAAMLLDTWQKKYDRRIETPLFFEIRMLIAAHGDGDWAKAREMVGRVRELVEKGVVPPGNWSWNNMTGKYYKYILVPEYEIKRQYRMEKDKERKRA
ncbi:MAG: hypothetical protein KKG09_08525 [Verrucomicrobia bacterium]|nr:hypothetical protein [Verrucomicrobiota bacterium]MBU4292256.1 hypothetical protein [Verrucomicrobiota bacterium]MBU4428300.1 hypothetical protein [Verrucomicrobiota bacterium]MBU4498034.1 hypothetical protein [Verrucomicrobiota bacterium]